MEIALVAGAGVAVATAARAMKAEKALKLSVKLAP